MASEKDFIDSGATTPYRPSSTFTAPADRLSYLNDDTETVCTDLTPSSIASGSAAPSIVSPDPPFNSPLTQSVVSDGGEDGPNVASLAAKLELMRRAYPTRAVASSYGSAEDFNFRFIMHPGSPFDDEVVIGDGGAEGEAPGRHLHLRLPFCVEGRGDARRAGAAAGGGSVDGLTSITPVGPSSHSASVTPTPGCRNNINNHNHNHNHNNNNYNNNEDSTEHIVRMDGGVLEYSAWENPAEEEVTKGLQRLTMLALDLHLRDPSRSVEEHYSERLSAVLRRAEIRFDCSAMH